MDEVTKQFFQWPDYLVFSLMLTICILIGIYFGFFQVSKNVTDYLVGNRSMSIWPVSISLVVSYISGISFLGIPTEIYIYGIQFTYRISAAVFAHLIGKYVFLPVFLEMQLTSTYEYLQRRFDSKVRKFGCIMFIIGVSLWLPIVIYVPALALNHVTEVNVHVITPIVCGICIFYTCVGGIRAVIWTDFLQAFMMLGSIILVIIKATINVGGIGVVFERSYASGRIEPPDFDPSVTKRLTFLGSLFGGTLGIVEAGILSQIMMQRYVSLPSLKHATKALGIFLILQSAFTLICTYTGLLIHAKYYDCDPVAAKIVQAKDQLLPLLVIDTLQDFPGTAGLFLAGVFSASLSSLSSGLNSMAAVILEDVYKSLVKKVSPKEANIVAKTTVVTVGVITTSLVFVVEKLGTILQLCGSLSSITSGPLLAIFGLGLLCPWVNAKGALYGGICGVVFMFWIVFGAQVQIASGSISYPIKNITIEGCAFNVATSAPPISTTHTGEEDIFLLYRISFMYYTFVGTFVSLVAVIIISYITGLNKPEQVDLQYLAPCVRQYFKCKIKKNLGSADLPPASIDLSRSKQKLELNT